MHSRRCSLGPLTGLALLTAFAAALVLAACTTGTPSTSGSHVAAPSRTAASARPTPTKPNPCASMTGGWTTDLQQSGVHNPGPIIGMELNHKEPCFERLIFNLGSSKQSGYRIEYVTRAEVVSDASGQPVPNVTGQAFLRIAILAPIRGTPTGESDKTGNPIMHPSTGEAMFSPDQIKQPITGVWFGGMSEGQTLFYVGLNTTKRPLRVGSEAGPQSSSSINVDIAR